MVKKYRVTIDDISYEVSVEALTRNAGTNLQPAPKSRKAEERAMKREQEKLNFTEKKSEREKRTEEKKKTAPVKEGSQKVLAPLPGNMWKVLTKEGQAVKKGDILFIIEAMKMENEIFAPNDGVIGTVAVTEGSPVNTGDLLCTIE